MTQKSRSSLATEINSNLADNTSAAITPALLRTCVIDQNDSAFNLTTDTLSSIGGVLQATQFPALTGDVTTTSGAVATTLATVNSNVGSFTNANITVNAKGLVTAASSGSGGTIPLTTKGDLFGYSTTGARIPIGTDTFVLTADSTQTLGLKWAAPSTGSGTVNSATAGQASYYNTTSTAVSGSNNLLLDTTTAASGNNAVKITGSNNGSNAAFIDVFPTGTDTTATLYLRSYNTGGAGTGFQAQVGPTSFSINSNGSSTVRLLFSTTAATFGSALAVTVSNTLAVTGSSTFNAASTFSPAAVASGAVAHLTYTGGADTGLTASTEATSIYWNMGQTRTHATGAIALQRDMRVSPTTHAFVAASTITDAGTLTVDGPPAPGTNGTITRAWSAMFNGPIQHTKLVQQNTAVVASPNLLAAVQSNIWYSNFGAVAENYHTLPVIAVGLSYSFIVESTQGIRVVAQSGDTIRIAASVSGSGGFVESLTIGNVVTLTATKANTWVATNVIGSWTVT